MKNVAMFSLALLLSISFVQFVQAQDNTTRDKATIQKAYDALNRRDWASFESLCTPNYTDQNVGPAPAVGIKTAVELYKQFQAGFPDFKIKINEIAPAGNGRYLLRVTITGTNTGSFMMLPPTGKPIKFDDADLVELNAEGKCFSHTITNTGEPLRQIGYGSLLNPGTQLIMMGYQKFSVGDIAGFLANCSEDVFFDIQDRMFDSKARMFKGKAEVGKFFQELGNKFQYTKFQPVRFVSDGEDVFVLIDAEYKHLPSGKTYASTYTHHFKVVNGKISFFRGLDDFQMMK